MLLKDLRNIMSIKLNKTHKGSTSKLLDLHFTAYWFKPLTVFLTVSAASLFVPAQATAQTTTQAATQTTTQTTTQATPQASDEAKWPQDVDSTQQAPVRADDRIIETRRPSSQYALNEAVGARGVTDTFAANCLSLDDVMQLSATRSPSVLISRGFEAEADTQITQAKSLFRPRVSAFGRSGAGDTGIVDSGVSNQAGLRASQRVFDFGDAKYARRSAQSNYEASVEDTKQARIAAALETGQTYLELLEAEEQIALTSRRRDYFAQQLTAIDRLLDLGAATRTERAAVASTLADAEGFSLELEFRRESALAQVQIDTETRSPHCEAGFGDAPLLTARFAQLQNEESAAQMAILNNPNIRALDKRADGLEADKQREQRSRLPIIEVVATGAYSSLGGFDQFGFQERVGLNVTVPLYAGNAISASRKGAGAREYIARSRVLDAKRELRKGMSISYRRIASLEKQLVARRDVEAQTLLQFEAAEQEQKAGTQTLRDLIEIRLEYEEAGLQVISTRYELERQRLNVLAATAALPID